VAALTSCSVGLRLSPGDSAVLASGGLFTHYWLSPVPPDHQQRFVSTVVQIIYSGNDCLERLVPEMTCNAWSET